MIKKTSRGFTLIELMIVVAIIGILAAIAIPNFLKYQLRSKSGEGGINTTAIKTSQLSYFGVRDEFPACLDTPGSGTVGANKQIWPVPAVAGSGWDQLGWQPEGSVYFSYTVGVLGGGVVPWNFTVEAIADIDANTVQQCVLYNKTNTLGAIIPPVNGACNDAGLTPAMIAAQANLDVTYKSSLDGEF